MTQNDIEYLLDNAFMEEEKYQPYGNATYRFALDEFGLSVDVYALTDEDRRDYSCISCNHPMRPVLGKKRIKHFRHLHQAIDCSRETYLHKMAKKVFFETYRRCLVDHQPYMIPCTVRRQCRMCEYGPCDFGLATKHLDLTKYFLDIKIEERDGNFIPDILLLSEKHKLYIEMVVSHPCEDEKLNAGIRIVEIYIQSEDDLVHLAAPGLSKNLEFEMYNFEEKPDVIDLKAECSQVLSVFIIHLNGKVKVAEYPRSEISQDKLAHAYAFCKVINRRGRAAFFIGLIAALQQGIRLRNCYACRYAAVNKHHSAHPIFCKTRRVACVSNFAAECSMYRQDIPVALETLNTIMNSGYVQY